MNHETSVRSIPVANLELDGENPRLSESLRGKAQSEILRFLQRDGVLEEIAQSYLDNGFFQHEPLIVAQQNGNGTNSFIVVEGNRRLAALKMLHDAPEAEGLDFVGIDPSSEQLESLREVPCFVISSRQAVHAYIGFRHIGGLKTWPPEAKARYLLTEVRRLVDDQVRDPFRELGRRVGSNAQGVRNPYLAIRILLYAREEFGFNVSYVQDHRFGVWLRCMTSADIRAYLGLDQARTYQEIEQALADLNKDSLKEVLSDLKSNGNGRAVLADSRYVTVYGRALMDERAHKVLRSTKDISFAAQIVDELELEPRARRLVKSVELFLDVVHRAERETVSTDLLYSTEELFRLARSTRDVVRGLMNDDDDNES